LRMQTPLQIAEGITQLEDNWDILAEGLVLAPGRFPGFKHRGIHPSVHEALLWYTANELFWGSIPNHPHPFSDEYGAFLQKHERARERQGTKQAVLWGQAKAAAKQLAPQVTEIAQWFALDEVAEHISQRALAEGMKLERRHGRGPWSGRY